MRYAIISDIHGNLAAFQAVLNDINGMGGIERIWCLGDVVGYGPDPKECIELLRQHDHICVAGNQTT
jgi:predicted phosphodiesterase